MRIDQLTPGTRLEVCWYPEPSKLPKLPEGTEPEHYVSQLIEPADGKQLLIAVPIHHFRHLAWPENHVMHVNFVVPNSGNWAFMAVLSEQIEIDQIRCYRVTALTEPQCNQRRMSYRLPCTLDLTYRFLEPDEGAESEQPRETKTATHTTDLAARDAAAIHKGLTRNISGGGALFVTDCILEKPCPIEVTLQLSEGKPIKARGQIIRTSLDDHSPHPQQISVQFTDISVRDQDSLIRYILKEQVRTLRLKNR